MLGFLKAIEFFYMRRIIIKKFESKPTDQLIELHKNSSKFIDIQKKLIKMIEFEYMIQTVLN